MRILSCIDPELKKNERSDVSASKSALCHTNTFYRNCLVGRYRLRYTNGSTRFPHVVIINYEDETESLPSVLPKMTLNFSLVERQSMKVTWHQKSFI